MTRTAAHSLVEQACRKRGREYGDSNADILRRMRAQVAFLKEIPTRWARVMGHTHSLKRHVGDGCFITTKCGGYWESAE